MKGWNPTLSLGALKAPDPRRNNPDSGRWNTFGVRGVVNQGFLFKGDILVVNDLKVYNQFLNDGWEPAELPR